jgi:hypothetical protein
MWGSHPISWTSKQQTLVTTSTTEAEFVAAACASKDGLWVRKLLAEIAQSARPFTLYVDNEAAVALIPNTSAGVSGRTKHIDVKYMMIRDGKAKGDLTVEHVSTHDNLADMLTRSLSGEIFAMSKDRLGLQ